MINELYQELILDHNSKPRNFGKIKNHTHTAEGYNPLCGDKINVYLKVKDNIIKGVSFDGSGCAISKASASLMTTVIKNKTIEEVEKLFGKFHEMLTTDTKIDEATLNKLTAFSGVKEFPMRVKCATLSWHTVREALKGAKTTTTE